MSVTCALESRTVGGLEIFSTTGVCSLDRILDYLIEVEL